MAAGSSSGSVIKVCEVEIFQLKRHEKHEMIVEDKVIKYYNNNNNNNNNTEL
jgi:hypothetical protein